MLHNLWRGWSRQSSQPVPRRSRRAVKPRRARLFLEAFEVRTLPSVQFTPTAPTVPAHRPDMPLGDFGGGFVPVEPAFSVSSVDPGNISVSTATGIRASSDAGGTFASPSFFPGTPGNHGGDTATTYDGAGRLFWVNLTAAGIGICQVNPTTGTIVPGTTFTVDNGGNADDKEFVAADPNTNNLFVVWTSFASNTTHVLIRRSTDQGRTWSAPLQVDNGSDGFVWPATVTVAPDGHVFVAYHSLLGFVNNAPDNSGAVVVVRFNNDLSSPLRTLAENRGFADITFNVQTMGFDRIIPGMQFWTQGAAQPQVLADPVRPGNIYVVSADGNNFVGDPMDVRIARSTDNGQTWSTSFVDFGPGTSAQMFPAAAIDPFGDIVVAYYDNRRALTNSSGRFMLDVFARYSSDGGLSWSPAFQVNDPNNPFDPDPGAINIFSGPPPTKRIGEYFGIALFGGTAYVAWNGNTFNGSTPVGQQVWFNSFAVRGSLTVTGTTGNDTINIQNLAGNPAFVEVLVNGQRQYVGLWSALTGITVAATAGNDVVNIENSAAGTPITVNLGGGNDTVNITPLTLDLGNIQANVTLSGGAGTDALNVDDQRHSASGQVYTLGAGAVTRTGSASISYANFHTVVVNGGSGSATYSVEDTGAPSGTTLNTGDGSDTVNIRDTSTPLTVNLGNGTDTVNVSSAAHNLNTIRGAVTANGGAGFGVLNVDDQGNTTAGMTYTLTSNSVTRTGAALIAYGGAGFSQVVVNGATETNGNTYNVTGTDNFTTTLNLNNGTQSGNDTVNVQATSGPLTVNGPALGETANVGNAGGVQAIRGALTLTRERDLTVNDAPDNTGRAVTLGVNTGGLHTITGIAPALITYDQINVAHVTVNGGTGGNNFTVAATAGNAPAPTTTINAGSDHDAINVGDVANTLNEIGGVLTVSGRGGNVLNLFDQGSTAPHVYNLTASSLTRTPGGPTVNFPHCLANLHRGVTGGGHPGGDVINVLATDPDAPVNIVADNGAVVNVGNDKDGLDELQGALGVYGGDDTVVLNVNDQVAADGQVYDLVPGELDRTGAAPIRFDNLQEVLNAGGGGNRFDVDGIADGTPVTLNTGTGTGNLVRMRRHDLMHDALVLHGQGTSDEVGYTAYTTDVYVNLLTGQGTDLAGFSGIHNITGGQGNNVIVADGSETTINGNLSAGSAGRNLIITGGGSGVVYGSGNGDILIGGATAYDLDHNGELQAIVAEWTRTDLSYADRVAHVLNGDDPADPYPLNSSTVFDNGAANTITGNSNGNVVNLYFVTDNDVITDLTPGETLVHVGGGNAPQSGGSRRTAPPTNGPQAGTPAWPRAASTLDAVWADLVRRQGETASDFGEQLGADVSAG